jgi:hypothetical protein
MRDIVERLRSNEQLPVCPFDRLSPHYWTMPDDKPCPICGQENTSEGPDKCRGADTRVMKEAADEIERLRAEKLELANHIDGCVRVAADALKRAEVAEAVCRITSRVGGARE